MEKFSTKYNIQINENYTDKLKETISNDLLSIIVEKIGESIDENTQDSVIEFITDYTDDKNNRELSDLIENNSVFDFYISYQNTIDDILYKNNFFDNPPIKSKISSLYDYTLLGTKRSIKIVMEIILNNIKKEGI